MKKRIMLLCGLFVATSAFCSNFPRDFQVALKLYVRGKSIDSEKAFLELSKQKVRQPAKDECLAYAAYSAIRQKKYNKAMEYTKEIKDKYLNMLCQMKLLQQQRQRLKIIQLSKNEKLDTWPDRLIYNAAMCRGKAYLAQKNNEAAEKDFLLAKNTTLGYLEIIRANYVLKSFYRRQLKDEAKALAAENEITRIKCGNAINTAGLFTRMSRFSTALKVLDRLKVETVKSQYWRSAIFRCYGDVYSAMGKNTKAIACYRKVVSGPGAPAKMLNDVKQKIAALEKPASK